MKYFSTFSGIGGFEKGIEQAYESMDNRRITSSSTLELHRDQPDLNTSDGHGRWTNPMCIGYSEIDKYATQIYSKHYPEHKNYGDITTINASELADFDLLVGGFPCQSFSIAGKRGGFEDTRGTMFFELARILQAKKPRLFLFENVKGLLSHDNGKTFRTIISTLTELGYDTQWQVLNSKNFGVPQNRERVFIIGHLRGTSRPQVFPIRSNDKETLDLKYVGAVMSDRNKQWLTDGKRLSRNFPQGQRVYDASGISATLASQSGGLGAKTGLYTIPVLTPDRLEKRQNGRRFKEDGEPSFTLTAQDKHGIFDGVKIRRLTPKECERLQGFPDGWTEGVSDTQRYKCLGNAVTVNVIQAIMEKLWLKQDT